MKFEPFLRAFYQPIFDATTGEITAVEALVRLEDPQEGILTPSSFFQMAGIDQIVAIDTWMLRTACRDALRLTKAMGESVRVNINISAAFLEETDFAATVVAEVASTGLRPELLQLEVTEQTLIRNISTAAHALNCIRGLGVTVAIDDFGTGYNTFNLLKLFPVDCLKIDGAFVRDIESDRYSREICSCLIDLGNNLGMNVIAESIESQTQASFLRNAGAAELQGFYLGKPAALEELIGRDELQIA